MLTDLKTALNQKLDGQNLTLLAKSIGYQNPKKFVQHLNEHVLNQPFLGLDHAHYDFRFSTPELIRKLAETLGIPESVVNSAMEEVDTGIKFYNQHQPYLFVKTDFSIKQNTMPIFALAALESRRRLSVPFKNFHQDKTVMNKALSQLIQSHYAEHQGKLDVWGTIIGYHYHHSDGSIDYWSPEGQRLKNEPIFESQARIWIP